MTRSIAVVTANPLQARKLEDAAGRHGFSVEVAGDLDALTVEPTAAAVVVDLDVAGATEAANELRSRFPTAMLAAFISVPDRARWEQAQAGGYDLVATRGAIGTQLFATLAEWQGPRAATRVRLFEAADSAGRIGVVHRSDTPVGPVAVYHLDRELCAVEDACPHAGATLSEGTLEGSVVTCPLHGSQFDVRSGERVRGPADRPLAVYDVVVEGGIVYLEIPADR